MASTDKWLSSFYFCLIYGVGGWPGCRSTAAKNGWNMGKNSTRTFGNNSCLSLSAGVGVGCVWSCPASHPAPDCQSSVPLSGEGGTRHKSTDLRESRDDRATGPDSALPWWHQTLGQWLRPITDPALLSCWAAWIVPTWQVSKVSRKQHLNYVKWLPGD